MSSVQNTNDLIEFNDRADTIDKSAGSVVQIVQNNSQTVGELPASLIAAAVAKITTSNTITAINKSESGSCESPDLKTTVQTTAIAAQPAPAALPVPVPVMKNLTQVCSIFYYFYVL